MLKVEYRAGTLDFIQKICMISEEFGGLFKDKMKLLESQFWQ